MNSKTCSIPESCSEVEVDLKRLDRMLQAAHRSSIDIKDSYDFYVLALKEFNKENLSDSYLYCDRAKYELTSAINDAKIKIKRLPISQLEDHLLFLQALRPLCRHLCHACRPVLQPPDLQIF